MAFCYSNLNILTIIDKRHFNLLYTYMSYIYTHIIFKPIANHHNIFLGLCSRLLWKEKQNI